MDERDWLAERFEEHRPRLRAVAYRMSGSLSDADDVLQDAWLRTSCADARAVDNLGGWLTTIVARVSLNTLRSGRRRREQPLDVYVPDPIVEAEIPGDPEYEALLADSVSLALLVVLEVLSPEERLAFVLHDTFAVPFGEIAAMLDRTPESARQLASRARRRVRGAVPAPDVDPSGRRAVVDAFFAAARDGDIEALVAVLDPDVVLRSDAGPGRPRDTGRSGPQSDIRTGGPTDADHSQDRRRWCTGRGGSQIVDVLTGAGHKVVVISRASGVDVITGEGLRAALADVDVIVDAATGSSPDQHEATEFFTTSARNLHAEGAKAGVHRIVAVSIIGIDQFTGGYNTAKLAHEQALRSGPLPVSILRAAQFHEFVGLLVQWGTRGGVSQVPEMRTQLVAARTVAEQLAGLATASDPAPFAEIAGPREEQLASVAELLVKRSGDTLRIEAAKGPTDPDSDLIADGGLLPGPGCADRAYRLDMDSQDPTRRDQIAEGLAEHPASKGMRFNILVTAVEIGGSIGLFHLARAMGANDVVSYLIGSIAPLVGGLMVWAKARKFSGASAAIFAFTALSAIIALVGSTTPKVLLYKDCATTALIGLVFLGSCVLARKPVVFYMAQRYGTDGTHDGMAIFDTLWDANRDFRTTMYVISYLWAALFVLQAAITALLIRQTSYSTGYNYDQILPLVAIAVGILGSIRIGRRRRHRTRPTTADTPPRP